jgi:cob(I)alamin adenosyltransferase
VRIYTRRGDDGTTGLLYGGRISKASLVAETYGTVDEAVADLGVARAAAPPELAEELLAIQRELFVVGADLATNPIQREKLEPGVSLTTADMVGRLEALIDAAVAEHPLPQEFIVPGSTPVEAALDVARTTVRRAERRAVQLQEAPHEVNPEALRYLNRLSDLLFVLARTAGGGGEPPSRPR